MYRLKYPQPDTFVAMYIWISDYSKVLFGLSTVLSAVLIIFEINRTEESTFKMTWITLIAIIPIFGALFYLFTRAQGVSMNIGDDYKNIQEANKKYLVQDNDVMKNIYQTDKNQDGFARYLSKYGGSPAYTNTGVQYYSIGERMFEDMKKELLKAEKFIFLEFFIINHTSRMWNEILEILKKKVKQGVEVRVMYDGMGCMYQKEKGSKNNHFKFLKQYLTLNRAEVFFADKIVLIEGDTERILLPAMIKKLDQENEYDIPLSSQNISIIEVGNYAEIYAEFIQFIGIKTLIITDIDTECYQTNKDNKPTLQASRVNDGTHTSNPAIKYYLKKRLEIDSQNTKNKTEMEDQKASEKYILTNLTLTDKIITGIYDDNGNLSWESDENGNVLIVYQIKEYNKDGKEYNARSFEDAFFHLNRNLFTERGKKTKKENITQCNSDFQGLKNVKKIFNKSVDSYDLAKDCVNKKTSFAMDILLNSESVDGKDFANWEIPSYIKEGLEWLQK